MTPILRLIPYKPASTLSIDEDDDDDQDYAFSDPDTPTRATINITSNHAQHTPLDPRLGPRLANGLDFTAVSSPAQLHQPNPGSSQNGLHHHQDHTQDYTPRRQLPPLPTHTPVLSPHVHASRVPGPTPSRFVFGAGATCPYPHDATPSHRGRRFFIPGGQAASQASPAHPQAALQHPSPRPLPHPPSSAAHALPDPLAHGALPVGQAKVEEAPRGPAAEEGVAVVDPLSFRPRQNGTTMRELDRQILQAYDVGVCAALTSMAAHWAGRAEERHVSNSERRIFRREAERLGVLVGEAEAAVGRSWGMPGGQGKGLGDEVREDLAAYVEGGDSCCESPWVGWEDGEDEGWREDEWDS